MRDLRILLLIASCVLFVHSCAESQVSDQSTDLERTQITATTCIQDLVKYAEYDVNRHLKEKDHVVSVYVLDNRYVDVVVVSSKKPYPDGPYWRCEVDKDGLRTIRVEYSVGQLEPYLLDVQEITAQESRVPILAEKGLGKTVSISEFELRDLIPNSQ